jgi:hypothetical protein
MLSSLNATGMPVLDAQSDFLRARRRQAFARAACRFARRGCPSGGLGALPASTPPAGATRLKVIPLDSIVGAVEPSAHFDHRFRPASAQVRARWERIALAHRKGVALPPIALLEATDGYYVVDGRHRVSVARALGHPDIEAWVTRVGIVRGSTTGPAAMSDSQPL